MQYAIVTNSEINWSAKGAERDLQNIKNLLNTFRYEVAYHRILGMDPDLFDMPVNEAIPMIKSEIINLMGAFFPEVEIDSVKVWHDDILGEIQYEVVVVIE